MDHLGVLRILSVPHQITQTLDLCDCYKVNSCPQCLCACCRVYQWVKAMMMLEKNKWILWASVLRSPLVFSVNFASVFWLLAFPAASCWSCCTCTSFSKQTKIKNKNQVLTTTVFLCRAFPIFFFLILPFFQALLRSLSFHIHEDIFLNTCSTRRYFQ